MTKFFVLILLVSALCATTHAQSVGPGTINAAGGGGTISGCSFDWSIGEMTLVSTFTGSSIVVTQGVLQPYDASTTRAVNEVLLKQLRVFPNPATSVVNLRYTSAESGKLSYRLMDMSGRMIISSAMDVVQGINTAQISVASLACASYMLEVTIISQSNITEKTSYKIEKLQ